MAPVKPVQIRFDFEKGPLPKQSVLEKQIRNAFSLVANHPLLAVQMPFFESAKAADWLVARGQHGKNDVTPNQSRRLRAVKLGSAILMEHAYDTDGRLQSTKYADGETVFYKWDATGYSFDVRTQSGRLTANKVRVDGLLQSRIYDNRLNFAFDYDIDGKLTRVVYPDGVTATRGYGLQGALVMATCGGISIVHKWTGSHDFAGYCLRYNSAVHDFKANDPTFVCNLSPVAAANKTQPVVVTHPLGVWRLGVQGCMEEFVTPFGDRFLVAGLPQSRPASVWSPAGLHIYDYDQKGLLSAVTHPNGLRSMIYSINEGSQALLVGPELVTLFDYHSSGRLAKVRDSNGDYCLYSYTRCGTAREIRTQSERVKLKYDGVGRLISLRFGEQCVCSFSRNDNGVINAISFEGKPKGIWPLLPKIIAILWQWLALRPTFRLQNSLGEKKGCIS